MSYKTKLSSGYTVVADTPKEICELINFDKSGKAPIQETPSVDDIINLWNKFKQNSKHRKAMLKFATCVQKGLSSRDLAIELNSQKASRIIGNPQHRV